MNTTTQLTERYIYAVTRSLPEGQRADIEKELRASIVDAIEPRIEAGEDPAAAERATLTELGDPMRLASGYADRPTWLIGPRYYFDWLRLVRVLFALILPITFVAVFIVGFTQGGVGQAFGSAFSVSITAAVHLAFWPTLIFAILERTGDTREYKTWSLDSLPQLPDTARGRGYGLREFIPAVVFLLFFAGALVWQQFFSVFTDGSGRPIPLLNPELWSFWLPYALGIIALELVFAVGLYAAKRWTWPMAILNVLLNLAFAIPAVWLLLTHQLWNVEYFAQFGWVDVAANWIDPASAVAVVLVAGGDIVDGFVRTVRANRVGKRA